MEKNIKQFIGFCIVGFSNTIIGYLIYVISLYVLRKLNIFNDVDIYIVQFIMILLSVLWSFYWNKMKVFKSENKSILIELLKTYASYALTTLFLAEILLMLWTKFLNINEYIAPLLTLAITVPLNFIIQKLWVFSK